jgi:hypothetical protein
MNKQELEKLHKKRTKMKKNCINHRRPTMESVVPQCKIPTRLKLLLEDQAKSLRNYTKKDKNEEKLYKPSSHDGKHRPTMPNYKFDANLQNFRRRSDRIVPQILFFATIFCYKSLA